MKKVIIDGNEATAMASYALSENAFVYPITPSSAMAENFDKWSCQDKKNIFDTTVEVDEMQSEAGVAGALHGSALSGSLTTTFTSSQGLLLMIPNMYKIAGEMLPVVMHVASRSVASHALNIFCDHSDVMSVRETGFCMLASSNPQEAYDFALASHLTSIKTSIPVLHFFDGFKTSHQLCNVNIFDNDELKKIYPFDALKKFKNNALTPNNPYQYGTNESSDIFFQGREKSNLNYQNFSAELEQTFEELSILGVKRHHIMEYYGSPNARYVVCIMASGFDTVKKYVANMTDEIGIIKINLYRPFDSKYFLNLLPESVEKIAVLDRTKEQGSLGEPLYLDICASVAESDRKIKVFGGRYGLGGKEFDICQAKAVFDNLKQNETKNHFTVGIFDDVTNTNLDIDTNYQFDDKCTDILFCGIGSDGTVSASKNITKIIGENANINIQTCFAYDSKKSGGLTRSFVTLSQKEINRPYTAKLNDFVVINNASFLQRYNFAESLKPNGVFIINSKFLSTDDLNKYLPDNIKKSLAEKNAKVFSIDANKIASENNIAGKISSIMQMAFFEITNLIDKQLAKQKTVELVEKAFAKKGSLVIENNKKAIDDVENKITEILVDKNWKNLDCKNSQNIGDKYIDEYISPILNLNGNELPVSKVNMFGKNQTGTTAFEKRSISNQLPKWIPEKCIECGKCNFVCPHAVIRSKLIPAENANDLPNSLQTKDCKFAPNNFFSIQISPEDCTGCTLCSKACPMKALEMVDKNQIFEKEKQNFEYLSKIENQVPNIPNSVIKTQFMKPYFEYSGACAGCGETPYIKLLTQLFGKSLIMANATGCSSIYGGSAPTCPYTKDKNNQGVAWANSLFEDNAEFGYGILKSKNLQRENFKKQVIKNMSTCNNQIASYLNEWLENFENTEKCNEIYLKLSTISKPDWLENNLDLITKKSIWLVGGDGWAYDIDFGGIDHILSTGENVKILVLDTEVYSNTGGQSSKSTPKNAITALSQNGKKSAKKRLALNALAYKNVYVAQISLGADMNQTLNAFIEAENYDGPSLIIAYAPCINHGIDMQNNIQSQIDMVKNGYWTLFRYNPQNLNNGKNPMKVDSKIEDTKLDVLLNQRRFANLVEKDKENINRLKETLDDNVEFYNLLKKIEKDYQNE